MIDDKKGLFSAFVDGIEIVAQYGISMDYGANLEDLLLLGKYNKISKNASTKNFPTKREGISDLNIQIARFGSCDPRFSISKREAIRKVNKIGFRVAEACELLTLVARHPDVKWDLSISALGSEYWPLNGGDRSFVHIKDDDSGRSLELFHFGCAWYAPFCLAVIKK